MPIFINIFLFFTMANLGLRGTSSFVGEFLLLVSAFEANTTSCFFATLPKLKGITAQLIRLKAVVKFEHPRIPAFQPFMKPVSYFLRKQFHAVQCLYQL